MKLAGNLICPSCGVAHPAIVDVQGYFLEDVFNCDACWSDAIDYIMLEFVKDGAAVPSSFIRQALNYFLKFYEKRVESGEYVHDEPGNHDTGEDQDGTEYED